MKRKIYTLWYQGFDVAPDIVKICNISLQRQVDPEFHELILLDSKNLFNYIDLPGYIVDKHRQGIISTTHLSDIVRCMLLKDNGGVWSDATMFFQKPIADNILNADFFTMKTLSARKKDITSLCECFFIAGKKDFPLFSFLVDFWLEYWKREKELITYLLTDHLIYIAYKENGIIRQSIDVCPSFHYNVNHFQSFLNKLYREEVMAPMLRKEPYIKMTYKFPLYEKTKHGGQTFYGKLKEQVWGR